MDQLILAILIIFLLLSSFVAVVVYFLKRQSERNKKPIIIQSIPRHMTINEEHQKISKEFEVLEKLDGNVEKEKAESLMNWAEGKAKPVE